MSDRQDAPNTLENIAAELTALAGDLARGKLRVGSRLVAIGNPLFLKTKQKITGDTAYFTLSFQVPLRDSDQEASRSACREPAPGKGRENRPGKELRLQGRPPEGKKIKKELARLWKTVSGKLEQGQTPTPAEEKALVSAFQEYAVFSEPAWQEEWRACFAVLKEALACARRGELSKAREQAAEVHRLTKACHQKHK